MHARDQQQQQAVATTGPLRAHQGGCGECTIATTSTTTPLTTECGGGSATPHVNTATACPAPRVLWNVQDFLCPVLPSNTRPCISQPQLHNRRASQHTASTPRQAPATTAVTQATDASLMHMVRARGNRCSPKQQQQQQRCVLQQCGSSRWGRGGKAALGNTAGQGRAAPAALHPKAGHFSRLATDQCNGHY
jgi:hypothetical protein